MDPIELIEAISFVHSDGKYTAVLFDPVDNGVSDDMLDSYNMAWQVIETMRASGYQNRQHLADVAETAAGEAVREVFPGNGRSHAYVLIFEEQQAQSLLDSIKSAIGQAVGGAL